MGFIMVVYSQMEKSMNDATARPETFTDALVNVLQLLLEERDVFKLDESEFVAGYHHSLGRWMRNEWGLWSQQGGLYDWFHSIGIEHADDMSGMILTSAHRRYNKVELDLEGQKDEYVAYWKEQA
jgi:hypothetical protein